MKDVNKTILLGRLGANPIQRHTQSGMTVTHFSVATTRRWMKEAKGVHAESTQLDTVSTPHPQHPPALAEETEWHRVVTWGKQAMNCAQYLKKGNPVYIEGSIRSHSYADKTGQQKTAYEIHAENVIFLSKRESTLTEQEIPSTLDSTPNSHTAATESHFIFQEDAEHLQP